MVLQGEATTTSIMQIIENERHAIVEGRRSLKNDFVKNYMKQDRQTGLFLCLTSRTAYHVKIFEVLENFLLKENDLSPLNRKTITAVVQEALSNAFLLSCLEISEDVRKDKGLALKQSIMNQLRKDSFGRRLLALEVVRDCDKINVKIYAQGKSICWDLKNIAPYGHIPSSKDQLHLVFNVGEG